MAGPSTRRWLVLAAALAGMALTGRLGLWQLDRARQKLDLQARMAARADLPPLPAADLARQPQEAEAQHHRRSLLRGRWLAQHTVHLDNRPMNNRQGFIVLTPLQLPDGDAVLVQRGWSPRDFVDRTRLAEVPTPQGEVLVPGRIAPPPSALLALSAEEAGPIRQNLDLASFSRETGLRLRPLSLQQTAPAERAPVPADAGTTETAVPVPDDRLLRQWPAPAVDVSKHHGYAFQWFAMCALVAVLTVWFQFIRPRRTARRSTP